MINRRLMLTGSAGVIGSLALRPTGFALAAKRKRKRRARKTTLTQFVSVLAYDEFFELVQVTTYGFAARTEPRNARYLQTSPRYIDISVVFHPLAMYYEVDFWPGVRPQINRRGYTLYAGARRVRVPSKPKGRKLVKLRVLAQELWWGVPERRYHGVGRPNRWISVNRWGWGAGITDQSFPSLPSFSSRETAPDRSKLLPVSDLPTDED